VTKPAEEEKTEPQPDAVATEEADKMEEDSDTEIDEDESDSDDLFAGLSAEQKAKMKAKMEATKAQHDRLMEQQKANDRENIRKTFKVYTECEDISDELVDFTVEFAQRHSINLDEKIANEGTLFLRTMREMMETKPKEKKSRSKRRRAAAPTDADEGSDWESGKNVKKLTKKAAKDEDGDEDWRAMEIARKAALAKERKKTHKTGYKLDGTKRVGRLLLDDALKSKEAQTGWSEARKKAFKEIDKNPNAYYYRFNKPGEQQKNGGIKKDEHAQFMKLIKEKGANDKWGLFAINMPGRVGYQCSNYYRQLVKDKQIYDPNYWFDGKKLHFKRGGKRDPAEVKYAFTVLKDDSKVWKNLPAQHPKKPAGLMSPAEAKKIAANPPDIAPAGFEKAAAKVAAQLKKNPPKKRKAPAGGGATKKRRRTAHINQDEEDMDSYFASFPKQASNDSDTEDETALPEFTDHFTKAKECRVPAISPYGHVAEYDSWTKALRKIQPKDTCPFTKQPLKRRQLVKLTSDNIDEYIDKIKNQDEAIKAWKAEQKKLAAEEAEAEKTEGEKATATA